MLIERSKLRTRTQARSKRNPRSFAELKASILIHGIIQPILVTEDLWVIDGHGRLQAASELDLTEVPVTVVLGATPEKQAKTLGMVANLQREDLSGFDKFNGFTELLAINPDWGQKDLAEALGISPASVTKVLSVGKLPAEWLEALRLDQVKPENCYTASQYEPEQARNYLNFLLQGAQSKARSKRLKKPTAARVTLPLPGGSSVQVTSTDLDVDDLITLLSTVLEAARKAMKDGLNLKTLAKVMADKAQVTRA